MAECSTRPVEQLHGPGAYANSDPGNGQSFLIAEIALCWSEPGFEIDLFVTTDLKSTTAIRMGLQTIRASSESIKFTGSRKLERAMQTWLGLSPFATEKNQLL